MDRLREFSIVTVSLPDSVRVSEFRAYVVGVHRQEATLQPVERVESLWLPEAVDGVLMSFRHGSHTVGLKGELRVDGKPDDLRFRVTDGVCIPRRRSTRLKLCAPASIAPVDGGAVVVCQTYDVGVDGVVLEGADDVPRDRMLTVTVMLPESPDAVTAQAVVTEVQHGGLCMLEFIEIDTPTRALLSNFISEEFRRRLEIVRSLRQEHTP